MADENRCGAEVFVGDDRWGGWRNRCELKNGHRGQHSHALTACQPIAYMRWTGNYKEAK